MSEERVVLLCSTTERVPSVRVFCHHCGTPLFASLSSLQQAGAESIISCEGCTHIHPGDDLVEPTGEHRAEIMRTCGITEKVWPKFWKLFCEHQKKGKSC